MKKTLLLLLLLITASVFADTSGTNYTLRSNLKKELHISGTRYMRGDLNMGSFDIVDVGNVDANSLTVADLTATRVVFAGAGGLLTGDADFTFAVDTLTVTKIGAFELTGKLTAGATEIEGSAFDINGGTVDGITTLGLANSVDVGNWTITANGFTADGTITDGTASLTGGVLTGLTIGNEWFWTGDTIADWTDAAKAIEIALNMGDSLEILDDNTLNYLTVSTIVGSEAFNFGNTTLNPVYNFFGTGLTTHNGNVTIDLLATATDAILTMDGSGNSPGTLRYESDNDKFIFDKSVTSGEFIGDLTGNADTATFATGAGFAQTLTVTEENLAAINYVGFYTSISGNLPGKTNSGFTFDAAAQSLTVAETITCEELFLDAPVQDYLFSNRDAALIFQSQSSNTTSSVEQYANNGDGGDLVRHLIFGVGTPAGISTSEFLEISYQPSGTNRFEIWARAFGSGTVRPIHLYTGANTDQARFEIDGSTKLGSTSNYTQFSVAGSITQAGTAVAHLNDTNIGGTGTTVSKLEVNGAMGLAIQTVTGNTTLDNTYSTLLVNASGNVVITLPTAASAYNSTDGIGRIHRIKKIDIDADTVTLDGDGTETIDGGLTAVITVQYETITIQSDGSNWHIL